MSDALLAPGLGVAFAVHFAAKTPVHEFVKGALTDLEFRDGLVFAIATLIVWPQLPDRYMGPLQALKPHAHYRQDGARRARGHQKRFRLPAFPRKAGARRKNLSRPCRRPQEKRLIQWGSLRDEFSLSYARLQLQARSLGP
jgi:hypothetical protein